MRGIALTLAALAIGSIASGGLAWGEDTPPADNAEHHHHDNDPAWTACSKKADDQKLKPEARREFMKTCLKSARNSGTPTH